MAYYFMRLLSLLLSVLAVFGLTSPAPEAVMSYTEEEIALLDEYLQYSHGAAVSLCKTKDDATPLWTGTADDLCALPACAELAEAGYVKYAAYIAFAEDGNQRLKVRGAKNAEITVHYNELRSERYSPVTAFKKNVFYRIDVAFAYQEGDSPSFEADSEYKLSVNYPSFGGVPSEEIKPSADIHLRDPYIMAGPDGNYYMTGTYDPVDWSNTKEIHVYRSVDLTSWQDLGAVWNFERDATWQKKLLTDGSSPIWAPELHYINGNYYALNASGVVYTNNGKGGLKTYKSNGKTVYRYFGPTGIMATGLKKIGSATYYFNPTTGYRETGLKQVGDKYYYFGSNGKMVKNKTVTISGVKCKLNSSGALTSPKPAKPAKITVKAKSKKTNVVSWKKVKGATGYIVYRSTEKKGQYKAIKTINKASTKTFTDKKAKSGQTYYYKVCAYKKIGSCKVTGKATAAKSVKTK